ncbi:MAG TPA: alpha-L-fucosidase [Longimicrobiaceae bacterium]|nr:alpha-L-fucosidase [Longimicrobiaceae bacterium]
MSISRREFLWRGVGAAVGLGAGAGWPRAARAAAAGSVEGPFEPTWESLAAYRTPDWFRDAKFGIWAHWGPQCVPERGDWYARNMYRQGEPQYEDHLARYGHPSKSGFKEIIHLWRAERWDPEHLVGLYERAGAKYFMALANHHDNMDLFQSSHQPWNSVALGPKKDLIGGWARAARRAGLPFGVSVHAAHAWSWYEVAQGSDAKGPLAGVPYDGVLTRAQGRGQWWNGLDPQELYAQSHEPGKDLVWDWDASRGSSTPDAAYCEKFYRRTVELIDRYHPDMIYFDDTVLPLYPVSDVGLRLAAHFYNSNMKRHGGRLEGVITGKILDEQQRRCMVWDIERGVADRIQPLPFQTDTCIGNWHYDRPLFDRHGYKTPEMVAQMLVDIVSKNGNLMLNIPLPGHGAPDSDELSFLADFTRWMDVNGRAIYGTRPWSVYGEGPSTASAAPLRAQGFNEGKQKPYTAGDLRFMQKEGKLYAFALAWPEDGELRITSLAEGSPHAPGRVERVELLGAPGPLRYRRDASGLAISLPSAPPGDYAYAFEISGSGITAA